MVVLGFVRSYWFEGVHRSSKLAVVVISGVEEAAMGRVLVVVWLCVWPEKMLENGVWGLFQGKSGCCGV
ncbi:hypothetical protein MTR67_010058 [Solanum verrucosum]|uniref:Uncharacterized protein n=1 Tax=Solanum verrucosum TaxID=315347 RepID=A0AAF0THZ3_SOLVR|nr:hypothetical protein MTR67_010058 [Solanum verrucosum]